jgi:hypothetical protein
VSLCAEIAVATDDWLAKRPPVNTPVHEVPPEEKNQIVASMRDAVEKTQ